jgi:hypothetical protein
MNKRISSNLVPASDPNSKTTERLTSKNAMESVIRNWRNFANLPPKLTYQRKFLQRALRSNCKIYGVLPLELRADKEVLLIALERGGFSNYDYEPLADAPTEFLDDVDIIKKSISKSLRSFDFASERIRTTPGIICELFAANSNLFGFLSEELRDNRKVVLAALAYNCGNFCDASERLRNDRAFVISCLKPGGIDCNLLLNAGPALQDDRRLIEKAIRKFGGNALYGASTRLLKERDLVKEALLAGFQWNANRFPDRWVSKDREMSLLATKHSSWMAFVDADRTLKDDLIFCIEAARANPECIPVIPWKIRNRAAFKKAITWNSGPTAAQIREAFEEALDTIQTGQKISGRGHAARVTLNRSAAAAVKKIDLPRIYKSGFGAKWLYPASLVREAARILDIPMDNLTGL